MNILGLVTSLKVEKSCKVIIILNEEGLSGPDKEDFKTQLEKVADTIVSFEPTPEEAAQIGIDKSNAFHARLAKNTQALGIVNIRVIKKIETLCCRLHDIVAKRDTRVLDQAVHTIALAGYAKFQPNDAPPLEFIRTYNRLQAIIGRPRNEADDPTHRHRALLVSYDFNTPDEFDAVIIEGVERGLFDEAAVQQRAEDLQERLRREDKNSSFKQAWMRFYGSFSNAQDTILDELNESVKSNVEVITPAELDRTVAVLKEFGRAGQAKEALQFYIGSRQEKAEFWNLLGDPLRATVADPDVRASFSAKFSAMTTTPDTKQILKHVAERDSWSPEELAHLASQTEAEYIAILKQLSGEELVVPCAAPSGSV